MNILQIESLGKGFLLHQQNRWIQGCKGVSISVPRGSFLGVVGRSGSGKSTILRCIYRTYDPTEGRIWYESDQYGRIDLGQATDRQMLALRRQEIGYVSQFLSVMPRTTARQHVERAVADAGLPGDARSMAADMLRYFRLPEALWDLYPNTFSGGERLRLNLAHAMVKQPRLLLLDEPTASLDAGSKALVRTLLLQMKGRGTSMVGIFHDLEFMDGVCDQIFELTAI